jgi:serine protease Do
MLRRAVALAVVLASANASIAFAAPPPLPAPGGSPSPAAGPQPGGGTNAGQGPAAVDADALRKGVVQIEQDGRPIAVGTVLQKDGRILTSLSALGQATEPSVRYADGSVVKTKIGHKHKAWDLALLIPQQGRWLDGLTPTDADPANGELKAFLPKGAKLAAMPVSFKGRTDAKSKEGDPLKSVIDLDFKGIPSVPGAPLLDANGRVLGVLVKACKDTGGADDSKKAAAPAPACTPITIAAPVYALRSFLISTPATATIPSPWLGLGGAPSDSGNVKGVKVVGVAPGSPAKKAGLKADGGDVVVAIDGQSVETPEQLAEVIAKRAIGQTVKFLVFSGGKFRDVPVILRPAP